MSSEHQIMAKAQMNQSWYDTHIKMNKRRKRRNNSIASSPSQSDNDSQDMLDIDQMMETFNASDLRDKIFVMQQHLYAYHDLLDEVEKIKAYNDQLERQHRDLLKECSEHKKKLKKEARRTVRNLENEVAELNMELAQSRSREDVHHTKMQDMQCEKETLEEKVKVLRERNAFDYRSATQPLNHLVLRKIGLFQSINGRYSAPLTPDVDCKSDTTENTLRPSFLSSFHRRGAVRDICESRSLSADCMKSQLDRSAFSRRESEGNTLPAIAA